MKRLLPALAFAVLALPAPAMSKEIVSIAVCGANGCHATHDRGDLRTAMNVQPQAAPDHGGAFYKMRLKIGEPGTHDRFVQRSQWIPSLRLIRNDDGPLVEFSLPYPATQRVLNRLATGLKPFSAAKLGPIDGAPQAAKVDEVVPPPTAGDKGGGSDGGGSGWAWSLLAIAPAGIAFWLLRRRRGRPTLA
jgi:hypothetical protein